MAKIHAKTYIAALIGTLVIFVVALSVSEYANRRKTEELKSIEDKIAVDILSLETQIDLITNSSCAAWSDTSLRQELDSLENRLLFMEEQLGYDNPEVFRLKRYYSLLEIKDYLIAKKMAADCKRNDIFILYFYAVKDCSECTRQEYMLRAIRQDYPQVRVYSFDYALDLPAVQTLISLKNVPPNPPVLDIQGRLYAGFETFEDMTTIIDSAIARQATTTATSSKKR